MCIVRMRGQQTKLGYSGYEALTHLPREKEGNKRAHCAAEEVTMGLLWPGIGGGVIEQYRIIRDPEVLIEHISL